MRRRKDKNKQIICVILFIFILLSGVFYAVYTSVGKEFISNEGRGNVNIVIRNETPDKNTVPANEEPVTEDKPLSNKTTTDNKTNNKNTTKPKNPNSNTTKPATNPNKEFNGLEVIRDHGNSNNNSTSNEQAGNNNSSSSGSSGGSSVSKPKSTISTMSMGSSNYADTILSYIDNRNNTITVKGIIYKANESDNIDDENIKIPIYIKVPEAYMDDNILQHAKYRREGFENWSTLAISTTDNIVTYNPRYAQGATMHFVDIDWGNGQPINYKVYYNIEVKVKPAPQPPEDITQENTTNETTGNN